MPEATLFAFGSIIRGELGPELQTEFLMCDCNRTSGHAFMIGKLKPTRLQLVYRPNFGTIDNCGR